MLMHASEGLNMTWSRQKSDLEALMVMALEKRKEPLSLSEIVFEIEKMQPQVFTGQTPTNSLYSIIYRRERRRVENGCLPRFLVDRYRNISIYSLNPEFKEIL